MDDASDRRINRTRSALKSALVELILEKGYGSITIMDIANRADYNRGTFYKHYLDKDDLLAAIKHEILRELSDALLAPYEGLDRVDADKIFPSTLRLLQHIELHKDQFVAMISANKDFYYDIYNMLHNSMMNDMHIVIKETKEQIDYEIMLSYRMSAFVGVIMYWVETGFKYSANYMAEQVLIQVNRSLDYIEFNNPG
ncbi:TetR/AcrR family transcriptional regulator [Cohnella thailandensis]|uniref:TetR/AcrR family transcriptional regulator n=1 Tax=Cohnella thailandensis TaxID=557557 RepID=A0A841T1P0_9BACL|nr:TetR/AcrR family transcriptional regulator [Cohnella thailandensis]MBB6637472.1 TetR/AcrR family transcriptional regulator [Cohnella thailandensis]MBP1977505.1 AcrR family transcriptional regulator [Cohnella thailandensis]